jgi:hypothetical protein
MELAFRHVRATLPERRAFLKNLPENPLEGIEAFKRLLTEQGLRRLSRECWRTMHQARGRLVVMSMRARHLTLSSAWPR